jgi:hypothetical protein
MNITFVSSNHAKQVFENSKFEQKDEKTNQIIRKIQLEKPIEVLFEGADIEQYYPLEPHQVKDIDLRLIKEDFAYLFVGHWMQGDVGEDRKNVGLLVKAFYETFKNKSKKPALILKVSGAGASYMDREDMLNRIAQIRASVNSNNVPNIYLLHGEFSDQEISQLYSHPKVKAMVSLTKGEGFGRPLLEFSLIKKPIITTNWSGHTDFLSPEFVTMINGELKNVHPTAVVPNMILAESQWFSPDHGQIGFYLKDVFENYKKYTEGAKRQAFRSRTEFSFDKMKEKLGELLSKNIPEFPSHVQIKLPTLKKIELPKLEKNG